ncbi:MAG: 4Fe-4S binding protein [Bacteroides uniformis]
MQEECPTRAIASENPIKTDEGQCISCGRCIALCPVGSRNYHYPFFGKKEFGVCKRKFREKRT